MSRDSALTACGTGMLISAGASEKRGNRCCCSPCAQEGALNVEEERKRGREERGRRATQQPGGEAAKALCGEDSSPA